MTITCVGRCHVIELIYDIFANGGISPFIDGYSSRGMGDIDEADSIGGVRLGYLFLY
jgi:hypothetical protein